MRGVECRWRLYIVAAVVIGGGLLGWGFTDVLPDESATRRSVVAGVGIALLLSSAAVWSKRLPIGA
jgi:hypothetical protein